MTIYEKEVIIINVYGPNDDDVTVFNNTFTYLNDNDDKSFIIGGAFNTVINSNIDKKNGKIDTQRECRSKLKSISDILNLLDIWRVNNPNKAQFTWKSNTKPPIFSRLNYFFISDNF